MKKHFSLGGILMTGMVIAAVMLSSCSSKPNRSEAINITIPSDAPIVMEINIEKLTLKSNIANYKDQMADQLVALDEKNESLLQVAEAMRRMDDGGLNFHMPVYLFTTANVDGAYLLASVRNAAEVNETVLKIGGDRFRIVEDEGDGLSWIENEEHMTVGVHNDEVMLLGTVGRKDVFEQLMYGGDGFFNTDMGRAMIDHAGDITLMVNAPAVNKERMEDIREWCLRKGGERSELFENDELWNLLCKTQLVWNLKFSVGEISLNIFNANEESVSAQVATRISGDVFDNIPARGLIGALAMGIDGQQLSTVITEAVKKHGDTMDNDTRMGLGVLSTLCTAMNGSAALSISMDNFSTKPSIVAVLPIAKDKIQYIFNMITGNEDKGVYLTGDETHSAISTMRTYQYGRVYPHLDKGSHAEGNYVYGFFDIQELIRLALASKHNATLAQSDFDAALLKYIQQFGYAELKAASLNEFSLILKLKDEKHNSLSVLLKSTFDLGIKYIQNREAQKVRAYQMDEEDWGDLEEVEW